MSRYKKHECVLCGTHSEDIPHFRFPKDILQRTIWANFCDVDPASMSVNHKLCYRHFAVEDLIDNRYCGGHVTKKQDAVPVIKYIENHEDYDGSLDEDNVMESVNITEKSSRILSTGIRKNAENTENNNSKPEIIEVVSCTPDTDDDDLESNVGVSDASEEDFSCNFDDMEDVKRTVTHLQNVIFERKRNIKSVQQKNRRLIKKIRRLKGDINEYAEKHCFNLDKSDTKSNDESN